MTSHLLLCRLRLLLLLLTLTTQFTSFAAASSSSSQYRQVTIADPGRRRRPNTFVGTRTNRRSSFARSRRSYTTVASSSNSRRSAAGEDDNVGLSFLDIVQPCSSAAVTNTATPSIGGTLLRGAFLRIASDLTGGTPLENVKTRVTITTENSIQATRDIVQQGGIAALWKGTPSRTVEGALIGAVFMLGSVVTKSQLRKMGAPPTVAALAGGLVGGVAQATIMTPAGLIFTSLNAASADSKEGAIGIIKRVVSEKGLTGMWTGFDSMCLRQATNWASRAGFTEIARSVLHLSDYGMMGEIASGALGGVGSCWNTPIETIRVLQHRDVAKGLKPESPGTYWKQIVDRDGYQGLFRGVTPRAIQAIWQTVFLVVVPNMMGM